MSLQELMSAQALRSSVPLQPIDGPDGRVFPPTFPLSDEQAKRQGQKFSHVVERVPNDGRLRVLVDSVASQANRQEAALVISRSAGLMNFADIYVDLSGTAADVHRLSATEMPHRLSDAILRDSEIGGVPFGKSDVGRRILSASANDLSSLIEASPTSIVYGCWFSQHGLARQFRIQRSTTSEIWADEAVQGQAVGSRIDPLGIERVRLFEAPDGEWTALEAKAVQSKGKPKLHAKKKRPSEVNHGNIPPTIREQGITAKTITLRWAMPLAAVRRLKFGGGPRDAAGQAYIAALGLLGRVLDHDGGYSLRSRCDLISAGPIVVDVIAGDGTIKSRPVSKSDALAFLAEAEAGMQTAGLKLHQSIEAKPGQRLIDLLAANRQQQEVGGDQEEETV